MFMNLLCVFSAFVVCGLCVCFVYGLCDILLCFPLPFCELAVCFFCICDVCVFVRLAYGLRIIFELPTTSFDELAACCSTCVLRVCCGRDSRMFCVSFLYVFQYFL